MPARPAFTPKPGPALPIMPDTAVHNMEVRIDAYAFNDEAAKMKPGEIKELRDRMGRPNKVPLSQLVKRVEIDDKEGVVVLKMWSPRRLLKALREDQG